MATKDLNDEYVPLRLWRKALSKELKILIDYTEERKEMDFYYICRFYIHSIFFYDFQNKSFEFYVYSNKYAIRLKIGRILLYEIDNFFTIFSKLKF